MAGLSRLEHGGNIHKLIRDDESEGSGFFDFSANINPLGPPAWLRSHINRYIELLVHYPDPQCSELVETIAEIYQVAPRMVVPANGTTELLHLLPRIVGRRRVLLPVPCYIDYHPVFSRNGFDVRTIPLRESEGFAHSAELLSSHLHGDDLVLFGNPGNPSGAYMHDQEILDLADAHRNTLFIIDEAFHDFIAPASTVGGKRDNIISLNSLTKFFGIPGLRIGFGVFPEQYAEQMREWLPQWSVNVLAQTTAIRALRDVEYAEKSRADCQRLRQELHAGLGEIPCLKVYDSRANYLLVKRGDSGSAEELYHLLLTERIIIRRCGNYQGLDHSFFRLAVRSGSENKRMLDALGRLLASGKKTGSVKRRAAAMLMFQGTSSNAGKSILSAAFCRILRQDGINVAPFKAQNMSLNSYVTRDDKEMGRAQVVQAIAAKVEPDHRMNPVLLKPNSDTGSQVIINGRAVANMDVRQYHRFKDQAWRAAARSFDELKEDYEAIVLEGAGSPGEVNLKRHDFVNMKMARYAGAPVLLVGDIDRGGVYASFVGIMDVLEQWERSLIAGFVVNKFRGDQSLLDEAHRFVHDHTGREVMAVIPYIADLAIPQEDSVSLREGLYRRKNTDGDQIDIAVIDLPHISNFTDIDPLYLEPDVTLRFVADQAGFGSPDAVIIPGSKNVAGDLAFLRRSTIASSLRSHCERGGIIVGICGGYQMLGEKLLDPHQLETDTSMSDGLGLIDVDTVLEPEKTLRKREGIHIESGLRVVGYEIHHGKTEGNGRPVLAFSHGTTCGSQNADGTVWGAYLHGIFDDDTFRRWFIDSLRSKRRLPVIGTVVAPYDVERSLDNLAEKVRECFDIKRIYNLMGIAR